MKSVNLIKQACIGGAFVAMSAGAQTSVTLYGRVDTDVEVQKGPSGSAYQMVDNASRWGMRGSEELGGGMRAVFGLEQGFSADTGASTTPVFRNSYVGLTSGFGARRTRAPRRSAPRCSMRATASPTRWATSRPTLPVSCCVRAWTWPAPIRPRPMPSRRSRPRTTSSSTTSA
ncbi:outer membrane protein (porin) [Cupriavidus basilensis OR16]|uniref:Outer membrane protein (Porin) n=1 Tax=Cupriavidus basilensis OR16 TaxID=1127483 RepID=H1SFQ8_9BURK|nr:outer membrane protein (porin) [Cupriavidus basilensis OR16]